MGLTLLLVVGTVIHTVSVQGCDPQMMDTLQDVTFSASSSYSQYTADQAALNSGIGWVPAPGTLNQYLHLDLLTSHSIIRLTVKSVRNSATWFVRSFALYHSQNNYTWERHVTTWGDSVLSGVSDPSTEQIVNISPPIEARYLVVKPLEGQGLRLEVTGGCLQEQNVSYTAVSDDIEDTQEWTLSGSPYVIYSNIRIKASGKVKVYPGVQVIFDSTDAGFLVDGMLEASGGNMSAIEFGYPRPFSGEASQWRGLEVTDQGIMSLERCNIYGAMAAIKGPLASIAVTNCHIHENNVGIHLTEGASSTEGTRLMDNRVANNSEQGIQVDDCSPGNSVIYLKDCRIVENGDSGLRFESQITLHAESCTFSNNLAHGISNNNTSMYGVSMVLDKCQFTNNRVNGFNLEYTTSTPDSTLNITISESRIYGNRAAAMLVRLYHPPRGMTMTVQYSHIENDRRRGIQMECEFDEDDATFNLVNNTFIGSDWDNFEYQISIDGVSTAKNTSITIQGNTFMRGMAFRLYSKDVKLLFADNDVTTTSRYSGRHGLSIDGTGEDVNVFGNRFVNCTTETVVAVNNPVNIHRNVFINPDSKTDIHVGITKGERLNASYNYWGGSDKFYVRSRVCDFFCEASSVIAEVHPFYITESLTELSTELDSEDFSIESINATGGILTESVTLGPDQYLIVTRSILIPEGFTLTILENVTLVFPFRQGIHVQGTIEIQGQKEKKVLLLPGANDFLWSGLKISATGSTIRHAVIRKCGMGVYIADDTAPVTLAINDSLFTGVGTAIRTLTNFSLDLILHKVEIIDGRDRSLIVQMAREVTVSINMTQCQILAETGMKLSSAFGGKYNISLYATTFTTVYTPCIEAMSCNTSLTLVVEDSTLISRRYPIVDLASSLTNVHFHHSTVTGGRTAVTILVCPVNNVTEETGTVDVQDSSLTSAENNNALDLRTVTWSYKPNDYRQREMGITKGGYHVPLDIIVKNNTFITMPATASVYIKTGYNCSSWNTLITDNNFERSGVEINGSVSNITINKNIFKPAFAVIVSVTLLGNGTSTTTISQNRAMGGIVILDSTKVSDSFQILENEFEGNSVYITSAHVALHQNQFYGGSVVFLSQKDTDVHDIQLNTFNGSQVFIKNPNVIVRRNRFYKGPPLSLLFGSNCYAEREVNVSHNYWGSDDDEEIANRIHDSKYDENLPKLGFIPFYRFPNLTDLQYPVERFLSPDGTIGGSVGGRVTLTSSGSPYTVTSSIVVGKLDTLIVQAGVTLLFPKETGLTVEGTLRVLGSPGRFVVAQPLVSGVKWKGVKLLRAVYRPDSSVASNIRLVDGCEGKEGRVEVRQGDTWGTVCGDGFDQNDARVVCRMLGYDPSVNHQIIDTGEFGYGTGDILMGKLLCDGTEPSLHHCPMSTFNCSHLQDVSVRCNGKHLPTPEDVVNEVELRHFLIEQTEQGLELNGNIVAIEDVNSTSSNTHGVTIYKGVTGMSPFRINGMAANNNRYSGLAFEESEYKEKERYLDIIISKGDMNYNGEYGIHILYAVNMSLQNSRLEENTERAIYLKSESVINIYGTKFRNNQKGVFSMNEYKRFNGSLQFSLSDSQLIDNVADNKPRIYDILHFFPVYTESCKYDITNNLFAGNNGNVVFLNTHRSKVGNVLHITNNVFQNNTDSIVMFRTPVRNLVQFVFSNNTVGNNTVPTSKPLLQMVVSLMLDNEDHNPINLTVFKNRFTSNHAPDLINIADAAGYQTHISVTRNVFTNNNISQCLTIRAYGPAVKYNIFNNPLAKCELESPIFVRGFDVDARLNYWGSGDVQHVVKRVCGFDTDMNRGFIHYLPYLLSDDGQRHSDLRHTHFWMDNLLGGVVEGLLHLNTTGSPYHITRSMYVRREGVLRIASGVVMQFQPGTGIYVEGILTTGEPGAGRVTLKQATNSSWYGVVLAYNTVGFGNTVRLVNGSSPNEGRVELCYNGSWTSVCHMDRYDYQLACRALGYKGMMTIVRDRFGQGSGSILKDLDCNNALSLAQCQRKSEPDISTCSQDQNVGVICRQYVTLPRPYKYSYLEDVSILGSREGLHIQTPSVRLSNCHINNTEKAGLTLDTDAIDLDLNGTVVDNGQSDGILVKVSKDLRIHNGTTQFNLGSGMKLVWSTNKAVIENINFVSNALHHEIVTLSRTTANNRLQISQNTFQGERAGIQLGMDLKADYTSNLLMDNNTFSNNNKHAISVRVKGNMDSQGTKMIFIRGNDFTSSTAIWITSQINISVSVEDNTIRNSSSGEECILTLDMQGSGEDYNSEISISANTFENVSGKCVAHLKSTNYNFSGSFNYNKILNSSLTDAAVLLDSRHFKFAYNIFDNPSSLYDLKVLTEGQQIIKAGNNWWGSGDTATALTRILDKQTNNKLLTVELLPILVDHNFDCSNVSNCGNGRCVQTNGCWCDIGWTGVSCSDYDCSDLYDCLSNGECVGPNQCNCSSGSGGLFCDIFQNANVQQCSEDRKVSASTSTTSTTSVTVALTDNMPVSGSGPLFRITTIFLWIIMMLLLGHLNNIKS